jgi:hypothetical protein
MTNHRRVRQDVRLSFLVRVLRLCVLSQFINDLTIAPLSYLSCLMFFLFFFRLSVTFPLSSPLSTNCRSLANSQILRHYPFLSHPQWPTASWTAHQSDQEPSDFDGDFRCAYNHFQDDVSLSFYAPQSIQTHRSR